MCGEEAQPERRSSSYMLCDAGRAATGEEAAALDDLVCEALGREGKEWCRAGGWACCPNNSSAGSLLGHPPNCPRALIGQAMCTNYVRRGLLGAWWWPLGEQWQLMPPKRLF